MNLRLILASSAIALVAACSTATDDATPTGDTNLTGPGSLQQRPDDRRGLVRVPLRADDGVVPDADPERALADHERADRPRRRHRHDRPRRGEALVHPGHREARSAEAPGQGLLAR